VAEKLAISWPAAGANRRDVIEDETGRPQSLRIIARNQWSSARIESSAPMLMVR
jgi:hypothetical protein